MPKDYRIFVGAFPAGELAGSIQVIRECYDPKTAAITPPHVTLAGTYWRSGSPTPENEAESVKQLEAAAARISPFELVLGGVRSFPPPHNPVIYLAVERTPALLATRQALLEALGADKHRRYSPHLTLAMRLKGAAARAMLDDLSGSAWDTQLWTAPIAELRLMQRGPQDPAWRAIAHLQLSIDNS